MNLFALEFDGDHYWWREKLKSIAMDTNTNISSPVQTLRLKKFKKYEKKIGIIYAPLYMGRGT